MDLILVVMKGFVELNEAMSHTMQGYQRLTSHSEEFWQNMVHWRRKWQSNSVFFPGEPHEQDEKAKRAEPEDEPPRSEGVQYATGKEQR